MLQFITRLGSLRHLYHFCGQCQPWCLGISLLALCYGVITGLFIAPADYQQGDCYRIIFIHVPCAILSLFIYLAIAFYSAIFLIWRVKVADILAYCLAPIGAVLTLCSLITGAIWGKPMWGTWWIWDARLTSELILLFLYLGYIGLYSAIPRPQSAAKACAVLAIMGVVDIPIIHYSVYWWNTLHQGATISKLAQPSISGAMLQPLLVMLVGVGFFVLAVLCIRVRAEILHRGAQQHWVSVLIRKIA